VWDEYNDWVLVSRSISLEPETFHLPIHAGQHPSLPAYFMRAGSLVLGDAPLAYRVPGVIAGLLTVALVYLFGRRWFGETGALLPAALLAVNEYHIGVSAFATEKTYYLFFMLAAAYFLCELNRTRRLSHAFLTGSALGLGVLCKYLTVLLIPVWCLAAMLTKATNRIERRAVFVSALAFLAVISPDVLWTLSHPNTAGTPTANIGDHLQRIGGLGLSRHPLVFYLRDVRAYVYPILGLPMLDPGPEYPTMNAIMGIALLAGVSALTTFYVVRRNGAWLDARFGDGAAFAIRLLGLWFWMVLIFFMAIRPGTPKEGIDPVAWIWIDSTLFPAALLVGGAVPLLRGWRQPAAAAILGAGAAWAVVRVLSGSAWRGGG
jgi:4-amino-4-deoxy-L-arabinose transferase-like glycosyltransferase